MPWFETSKGQVWAGCHRVLGAVVFDPADQKEVPARRVRLFVTCHGRASLRDKRVAHDCITNEYEQSELRRAVDVYCLYRVAQEKPIRRAAPPLPVQASRTRRRRRSNISTAKPAVEEDVVEARLPVSGVCVRCDSTISAARLEAVPGATRCVSCQSAWERESGGTPASVRDLGEVWFPRSEHWRNRGSRPRS